jgi:hypothetical protein
MPFGDKNVRVRCRGHVGGSVDKDLEVGIGWVTSGVDHEARLQLEDVRVQVGVGIINARVVEVAVSRQVVHEGFNRGILLLVGRELHCVSSVQQNFVYPRSELVVDDFIYRGVLLASYHNVLLAEPLSVGARHLVISLSREEGYLVVVRFGGGLEL